MQVRFVRLMMLLNIWWIGALAYRNPIRSLLVLSRLIRTFSRMLKGKKVLRAFNHGGKYLWDIYNPAWPSKAFNSFFKNHLHEVTAISDRHYALRRLIVAITKKCPLNCEHCSEGDTLNQRDVLSLDEFYHLLDPIMERGIGQIYLSGGEPLNRFDDLLMLTERYSTSSEVWIYTSGYGLSLEKAVKLKKAGLFGAAVSLDHHIPEKHNAFRRNSKSYFWVEESIRNLQAAGIFVALNICPTREYLDNYSFQPMVAHAKGLNVPVISILEPRAVGHYFDKDVELSPGHKAHLREVSEKYNFNYQNIDFPTVIYPGAYREAKSCGGGFSYMFIDYDGKIYPCPFCKTKVENIYQDGDLCLAE